MEGAAPGLRARRDDGPRPRWWHTRWCCLTKIRLLLQCQWDFENPVWKVYFVLSNLFWCCPKFWLSFAKFHSGRSLEGRCPKKVYCLGPFPFKTAEAIKFSKNRPSSSHLGSILRTTPCLRCEVRFWTNFDHLKVKLWTNLSDRFWTNVILAYLYSVLRQSVCRSECCVSWFGSLLSTSFLRLVFCEDLSKISFVRKMRQNMCVFKTHKHFKIGFQNILCFCVHQDTTSQRQRLLIESSLREKTNFTRMWPPSFGSFCFWVCWNAYFIVSPRVSLGGGGQRISRKMIKGFWQDPLSCCFLFFCLYLFFFGGGGWKV